MIIKQIILVSILGNIKSTELRIRCILMLGWKRFLAPIGSRRITKATCWNTNSLMDWKNVQLFFRWLILHELLHFFWLLCSMPWCWPCLWSLLEHHLLQLQQRGYHYSLRFCLHCKYSSTKSWIIILNFTITTVVIAMVTWTKWSDHILVDGHWLKLIVPYVENNYKQRWQIY